MLVNELMFLVHGEAEREREREREIQMFVHCIDECQLGRFAEVVVGVDVCVKNWYGEWCVEGIKRALIGR